MSCMSQSTNTVVYMEVKSNKKLHPFIYHTTTIHVPTTNMSPDTILMPHLPITSCTNKTTISVYTHHSNSMQSIMLPGALVYIPFTILTYTLEQIFLPYSTYISHCSLHYCTHPSKINELQHLFVILLHNMSHKQICPSNPINMAYAQITWCTFMKEVCQYTSHIWSCPH